jgi:hypothetical protein
MFTQTCKSIACRYLWQQGFYIEIDINRISIHYVITAIIPIGKSFFSCFDFVWLTCMVTKKRTLNQKMSHHPTSYAAVLNVWLAFLVYSISPSHLDTRLTILVTLFLSLTALMFVISTTLPQSSDVVPTQQLFIVSFSIVSEGY